MKELTTTNQQDLNHIYGSPNKQQQNMHSFQVPAEHTGALPWLSW